MAQKNEKGEKKCSFLKEEQTTPSGIRLKTQSESGEVLRMEIVANGTFTVEGMLFVEERDIFGELYHYYKVLQPEIVIKGDITSLSCDHWALESIDLSNAPSLQELSCHDHLLISLDISHNPELKKLVCSLGDLNALVLSSNTKLEYLDCSQNQLEVLDLQNNTALQILSCQENKIKEMALSPLTELREFFCDANALTSLDCSSNQKLQVLKCNANQLTTLNVDSNTELKELQCAKNRIKNLSINSNTLVEFYISECNLQTLSIAAPTLDLLVCYGNELTSLDLSKCSALNALSCHTNKLKNLDLSGCPKLEYIWCNNNELERIDFSVTPLIFSITCHTNCINDQSMAHLIQTLPKRVETDEATIILIDTKNTLEKNECSANSVKEAKSKFWNVYDYDGGDSPYPGAVYEGKETANDLVEEQAAIYVYPNPVTDYLLLRNNTNTPLEANLFSDRGELLLSLPALKSEERVDVRNFSTGNYVLHFGDQSFVILKR